MSSSAPTSRMPLEPYSAPSGRIRRRHTQKWGKLKSVFGSASTGWGRTATSPVCPLPLSRTRALLSCSAPRSLAVASAAAQVSESESKVCVREREREREKGSRACQGCRRVSITDHQPSQRVQIALSRSLICAGARRNPATCGTRQGDRKRGFAHPLRAGGCCRSSSERIQGYLAHKKHCPPRTLQ